MRLAYLFGSPSDEPVYSLGQAILDEENFEYDFRCLSAHRVPQQLRDYLEGYNPDVIIAGAGLTNALANACTEHGLIIGVPIGGLSSFLSTIDTPPGYPIATVPVDHADVAARIALKLTRPSMVLVDQQLNGTKVTDLLTELGVNYELYENPGQCSQGNGVVISAYSLNDFDGLRDLDLALTNTGFFCIGVNPVKYTDRQMCDWMEQVAVLGNTVLVGNKRLDNAGILAAQMVGLHNPVISRNLGDYRAIGATKYNQFFW